MYERIFIFLLFLNLFFAIPSGWTKTEQESYIEPQFQEVKNHNDNKIGSLWGFGKNKRDVSENEEPNYSDMFKWVDLVIGYAHVSIDEQSIPDNEEVRIYWGWGEDHISSSNVTLPAASPCEDEINNFRKRSSHPVYLDNGHMKFQYYDIVKEVRLTYEYRVIKICPDRTNQNFCKYHFEKNNQLEEIVEGSHEDFKEYVIRDIYEKTNKIYDIDTLRSVVKMQQLDVAGEEPPSGCIEPVCSMQREYYYINPVPVPFNQTEYNSLFRKYNDRTYSQEPWLDIELGGNIKMRVYDIGSYWVFYNMWFGHEDICVRTSYSEYIWDSKPARVEKKSYFVEQGDVEWFHITPILGEQINNDPELEFLVFANRKIQKGYSKLDEEVLANHYMRKFDVYEDVFELWHVVGSVVNQTDFSPPGGDPKIPENPSVPHTYKGMGQSEKQFSPYQITYSNNSFRWVNYYYLNFTSESGGKNFTHIYYDVFGNEFVLSRNIFLRIPTWIVNGEVYPYNGKNLGPAKKNTSSSLQVYYFEGNDIYRSSTFVEHTPEIYYPNMALLFGGTFIVISVLFMGRRFL